MKPPCDRCWLLRRIPIGLLGKIVRMHDAGTVACGHTAHALAFCGLAVRVVGGAGQGARIRGREGAVGARVRWYRFQVGVGVGSLGPFSPRRPMSGEGGPLPEEADPLPEEGGQKKGLSEEDQLLAIGIIVLMVLLTLFVVDQCKRKRNGEQAMSQARRVQQDRKAKNDGTHIIDRQGESKKQNNAGAYRAVSYEHNNPTYGRAKGGTGKMTMVRSPGSTPPWRVRRTKAHRLCIAAGLDARHAIGMYRSKRAAARAGWQLTATLNGIVYSSCACAHGRRTSAINTEALSLTLSGRAGPFTVSRMPRAEHCVWWLCDHRCHGFLVVSRPLALRQCFRAETSTRSC